MSHRAALAVKFHLIHSLVMGFAHCPLLKSSWNCGSQTQYVKNKQGAVMLASYPGAGGSLQSRASPQSLFHSSVLPRQSSPGQECCNSHWHP